MRRHIEKLKEKPDHIKRRIALFTSLSFTFILFFVWIATYKVNSSTESLVKAKTPLKTLTASVGSSLDYIKDMFSTSNEAVYEAQVEVIKGKR